MDAGVPLTVTVDDIAAPLISRYEDRVRELEKKNKEQLALFENLRRELDSVLAVRALARRCRHTINGCTCDA